MNFRRLLVLVVIFLGLSSLFIAAAEDKGQPDSNCLSEECLANAAEANSQYVKSEDLLFFAENLARAGRFNAVQAVIGRMMPSSSQDAMVVSINRHNAEQAVAFDQFAAAALMHPQEIANSDFLDTLNNVSGTPPKNYEIGSYYWLAVEKIVEKFEPNLVSPDLTKLLRSKVARHGSNATLDDLLRVRWPAVIEKVDPKAQGDLWDYVAQVYAEMGDKEAIAKMLELAEQRGAYDFQGTNRVYGSPTWGWLGLGNLTRALKAARQTPKDATASLKVKIAEAMLMAGQKKQANELLHEAVINSADESKPDKRIELLGEIVDGYMDAGNIEAAKQVADKMLDLARLPGLFPAAQLTIAAKAYIDVGDQARAVSLLHEAVEKLPDPHKTIAAGVTLGPISGSTLGVGDSIRSTVAIEFYRAGDRKDFDEQFVALPSDYYQPSTWLELYSVSRQRHETSPSISEVLDALPSKSHSRFLSDIAVDAISANKSEEAKQFLRKAIDEYTDTQSPQVLIYTAKVAFAGGFSQLVADALNHAAIAAQKIEDKGDRAKELAAVAAFEHELNN